TSYRYGRERVRRPDFVKRLYLDRRGGSPFYARSVLKALLGAGELSSPTFCTFAREFSSSGLQGAAARSGARVSDGFRRSTQPSRVSGSRLQRPGLPVTWPHGGDQAAALMEAQLCGHLGRFDENARGRFHNYRGRKVDDRQPAGSRRPLEFDNCYHIRYFYLK